MNTRFSFVAAAIVGLLLASTAGAVQHESDRDPRNFDARIEHNRGLDLGPTPQQLAAVAAFRQGFRDLSVDYDLATGATRSLFNRVGFLTGPQEGDPAAIGLAWVEQHLGLLGLTAADYAGYEITDTVRSRVSGTTHVYLVQKHGGLPLWNGQLQVHVSRDGRILSVNNLFMPDLASAVNAAEPALSAAEAVEAAAAHLEIVLSGPPQVTGGEDGVERLTVLSAGELSQEPIEARLAWLPVRRGDVRLVWNFGVYTLDSDHYFTFNVDAQDGRIWVRFDAVHNTDYRAYQQPVESPLHAGTPTPTDDLRVIVNDPENATASSLGWHNNGTTSFAIHRGNNVHAYDDADGNNLPPASQPTCTAVPGPAASLCDFNFPINLATQAPATYRPAAVSNLFYWNNIIHDIQYQYGFDEMAGNFQVSNFANGGLGNDAVNAEAQDPGNCNANMLTLADGVPPRMQMFLCTMSTPARDGDFDNLVIVHEYGHGISIRQVGGPANPNCLNNSQQGGEGYSDWWGLAYTARASDTPTMPRGVGTYLFGQPPTGPGIRTFPYSTDPTVNSHDYESINGIGVPHGVGSVWAQVYWKVYWMLVQKHGFDPDLYDATGGSGNQRAMLYINEAMQNSICSPAFTDMRDAVLQSVIANNPPPENQEIPNSELCDVWEVFADFGLGVDAVSGGPNSTNPTNGFEIPLGCQCAPAPIADAGADRAICPGDSTVLGTPAQPDNTYLWAPGGETTAQITVFPAVDTTYTVTATTALCGSEADSVTVSIIDPTSIGIDADFELGADDFTPTGLWHLANPDACADPNPGGGVQSFYYGRDGNCDYDTGSNSGTLTSAPIFGLTGGSTLSFRHWRQVESFNGSFDITEVRIIAGGVPTVVFMLDATDPSPSAWQTVSGISLAAFAGQPIQVQFSFVTGDGTANDFVGWFIDDVVINGINPCNDVTSVTDLVASTGPVEWGESEWTLDGTTICTSHVGGIDTGACDPELISGSAGCPAIPNDWHWTADFDCAGVPVTSSWSFEWTGANGPPPSVKLVCHGGVADFSVEADLDADSYVIRNGGGVIIHTGTWSQYPDDRPAGWRVTANVRESEELTVFVNGFECGTLDSWSSVMPGTPLLPNCNCYFSGDCPAGQFCNWGPGGPSTEDNCHWRDPKPNGIPGAGCDIDHPGPFGAICDGVCTSSLEFPALANESPALLAEGTRLWGAAMLEPAAAGPNPVDAGLAAQALDLPFTSGTDPYELGRHVADLLIRSSDFGFYDHFCGFEHAMPNPETYVDLSGNTCALEAGRLAVQALAAELESPASGAGYIAQIPNQCPNWEDLISQRCAGSGNVLECLIGRIRETAQYLRGSSR